MQRHVDTPRLHMALAEYCKSYFCPRSWEDAVQRGAPCYPATLRTFPSCKGKRIVAFSNTDEMEAWAFDLRDGQLGGHILSHSLIDVAGDVPDLSDCQVITDQRR
jgi:hypothetical protein